MLIWTIRRRGDELPAPLPAGSDAHSEQRRAGLRFVMHRHMDGDGLHIDLRIERPGGILAGWRLPVDVFDRLSAGEEVLCALKREHPVHWLDHDSAECTVVDRGEYSETADDDGGTLRLVFRGEVLDGEFEFRAEPGDGLVMALAEAVRAESDGPLVPATVDEFIEAARDGQVARARAIERLCGLGRELDGEAFDEGLWRRMLDGLGLADIHRQTAKFERRFDEKYPPLPVTRAAPLPEDDADRREVVAAILEECV